MRTMILAAAVLGTFASTSASAVVVPGLFNTGVGVNGAALPAGDGQTDANWFLTFSDITGVVAGGNAETYYNAAYVAENAGSRWISYDGQPFNGAGDFIVEQGFDLTGYDPATAMITGLWGVDNEGEIFLNAVSTGITLTGTVAANFNQLYRFSITSGFLPGINVLSFVVTDTGQPGAVRADSLVLTADVLNGGVPEAATWTMLIAGFGLVGAAARRRRVAVAA